MSQPHPCRRGKGETPCGQFMGPSAPWGPDNCLPCYLFATNDDYKRLWGESGTTTREPGTVKKIGHFLKAIGEHALAGMKTTSKEESDERMAICLACPSMPDKVARKCLECGCYMEVKVTWNEQKCPIGKW